MKYQTYNRKWKKGGRVLDLSIDGPHLNIQFEDEKLQLRYHPDHDQIKVNDWIAVDDNNQLTHVVQSQRAPLATTAKKENLKKWSLFVRYTRDFFDSREFIELHTPSLVRCPGTEPALDVFSTELKNGSKVDKLFLPTSPEIHLKKALTMGFDKVYEIAKCFRNNEVTDIHQPEFWMLEWYRTFANLFDIQADVVKLIYVLCDQFNTPRPDVRFYSVRQLFRKYLNFDLTPKTTCDELRQLALQQHLKFNDSFSIDDFFFLLMLDRIEPELPKDCLVFVEKYPPFQAALARKDNEGWADRFEVYWRGMEIANAFDELIDPAEQRSRAQEDLKKREGRTPINLDDEFFDALESGMPPSAGIALGLERLFMAITGIRKIDELRLFPIR